MKTVLLTGFWLASSAFAFLNSSTYTGGGTWKADDNTNGTWTEILTVEMVEASIQMTSHVKVFRQEELIEEKSITSKIVSTQNGFFKVMSGDREAGNGYCFDNVCHLEFSGDGESSEETVYLKEKEVGKMGSSKGSQSGNSFYVAWRGSLNQAK